MTKYKFAIIADTSQDFTFELADKYGIKLVPYTIQMGDKHYKDLIELSKEDFYKTIDDYDTIGTSTPAIQTVVDAIKELIEEGYEEVLAVTSSRNMTGMANLYLSIDQMNLGIKIKIFDGEQIGSAGALLTLEACKLRDQGLSIDETYKRLVELRPNATISALFRNLKYLVAGGRISKTKAAIGGILKISPILIMRDTRVGMVEKVRGDKKSLKRLVELIKERIGDSKDYDLVLYHGDDREEFDQMKEMLEDEVKAATLYLETVVTPVLGVHTGPKTIGYAILNRD